MKSKYIKLRDWLNYERIINWGWQFSEWHSENTENPVETLSKYIEKWFYTFDWADIYSWVEEIFWETIKRNSEKRELLKFNTKHVPDLEDIIKWNITVEKIRKQVLRSCKRIWVEVLDNVQFHWWDYNFKGYEISIKTLLDMQKEKIIRNIWITNTNVDFLKKLEKELGFIPFTSQNQYSIIDRRPEKKLIPYIVEREIWLYCYGSLMGWLLSWKYLWISEPQEPIENRSLRKYLRVITDWWDWNLFQELLKTLDLVWKKHNATISEIATSWVLKQKWVSSVIIWVRNSKHIDSLDKILNISIDKEDLDLIDSVYFKWDELKWDIFDLERNEPRHKDIMKFNLNKK